MKADMHVVQVLLDLVTIHCKAVMYSTDGIYVNGAFKIIEELMMPYVESKQVRWCLHICMHV
jgi:hypothetical protein